MRTLSFRLLLVSSLLCGATLMAQAQRPNVRAWGATNELQCTVPQNLTNAIAVASYDTHNLAVRADGSVATWGKLWGTAPAQPPADLTNAVAVGLGWNHFMAVRSDGTLATWGANVDGVLNIPAGLKDVVGVSGGYYNTAALKADGTVEAWGYSGYGACDVPDDLTNAVAVSSASLWTAALRADGTVTGWGLNDVGQVTSLLSLSNIVAIAAGSQHCLGLTDKGTVVAVGTNQYRQCDVPGGLTNVVAVAAGFHHSLALRADGTVVAWGRNNSGQCDIPADLPFVVGISAGSGHSVALLDPHAPPRIVASPRSQSAAIGSSVYLRVSATGSPPLYYQWYFGATPLFGETNAVLKLKNLRGDQTGAYTVEVTNQWGVATSGAALVNVLPSLEIHVLPGIVVKGEPGDSYQVEYLPALGPTNAWTSLATVTLTNSQQYYVDFSAVGQPARLYRLLKVP